MKILESWKNFKLLFLTAGPVLVQHEKLTQFAFRVSGKHQFYVSFLAILVTLANFAPVEIQRRIIDDAILNKDASTLVVLCTVLLVILLVQSALKYGMLVYQSWVGENVINAARKQVTKTAEHPTVNAGGQITSIMNGEISQVGTFVGNSISEAVVSVSFIVVTCVYLLILQPWIAAFSILLLVPQVLLAPYLQPKLDALVARNTTLTRKLGDDLVELTASQKLRFHAVRRGITAMYDNQMSYLMVKYALKGLLNMLSSLAPLAALFFGGLLVIRGDITIGTVVAFVASLDRMATPLRDLLNFYRDYSQTRINHTLILQWLLENQPDSAVKATPS